MEELVKKRKTEMQATIRVAEAHSAVGYGSSSKVDINLPSAVAVVVHMKEQEKGSHPQAKFKRCVVLMVGNVSTQASSPRVTHVTKTPHVPEMAATELVMSSGWDYRNKDSKTPTREMRSLATFGTLVIKFKVADLPKMLEPGQMVLLRGIGPESWVDEKEKAMMKVQKLSYALVNPNVPAAIDTFLHSHMLPQTFESFSPGAAARMEGQTGRFSFVLPLGAANDERLEEFIVERAKQSGKAMLFAGLSAHAGKDDNEYSKLANPVKGEEPVKFLLPKQVLSYHINAEPVAEGDERAPIRFVTMWQERRTRAVFGVCDPFTFGAVIPPHLRYMYGVLIVEPNAERSGKHPVNVAKLEGGSTTAADDLDAFESRLQKGAGRADMEEDDGEEPDLFKKKDKVAAGGSSAQPAEDVGPERIDSVWEASVRMPYVDFKAYLAEFGLKIPLWLARTLYRMLAYNQQSFLKRPRLPQTDNAGVESQKLWDAEGKTALINGLVSLTTNSKQQVSIFEGAHDYEDLHCYLLAPCLFGDSEDATERKTQHVAKMHEMREALVEIEAKAEAEQEVITKAIAEEPKKANVFHRQMLDAYEPLVEVILSMSPEEALMPYLNDLALRIPEEADRELFLRNARLCNVLTFATFKGTDITEDPTAVVKKFIEGCPAPNDIPCDNKLTAYEALPKAVLERLEEARQYGLKSTKKDDGEEEHPDQQQGDPDAGKVMMGKRVAEEPLEN